MTQDPIKALRDDFPVLRRQVDGKSLLYLDSAATSLKPMQVLEAERRFSTDFTANIHRGKHLLSEEASAAYEDARQRVARFIGGVPDEVVFTRNATEALNMVAAGHSAGGSSGGGAAAVAAGLSYFDVGTDAGGSIRVPAHFCGVAGLKTTSGRIPLTGCTPAALGPGGRLVAAGPIARSIADLRLVLSVVQGPDEKDIYCAPVPAFDAKTSGLRAMCFPGNPIYTQHREVTRLVTRAIAALGECGIEVVTSEEDDIIDDAFQTLMQIVTADGADWIRELLKELGTTKPHEWTQGTLDALEGEGVSAKDFLDAATDWDEIQRFMYEYTRGYDLVVGPVVSTPTLPHGECVDVETIPAYAPAMFHNITGWPAVSVPVGLTSDGLPVGFQIAAKAWREADCLFAAELLEQKMGTFEPPEIADTARSEK